MFITEGKEVKWKRGERIIDFVLDDNSGGIDISWLGCDRFEGAISASILTANFSRKIHFRKGSCANASLEIYEFLLCENNWKKQYLELNETFLSF